METDRTRVRRKADRARYDREVVNAILDEAPICHVGFVRDGTPVVLPTIHARIDDTLYLHGSSASGMLTTVREGAEVCVTVTLLDGLVFARSAFHHSMNYRSVVVLGPAREVTDADEKMRAMRAVVEHVARGRWDETRAPTVKETAATLIVAVPIMEASAKVREGGPIDDDVDMGSGVWAGVVPLRMGYGSIVAETPELGVPESVRRLVGE